MSNQRRITIKVCRRADYLMFRNDSTRSLEVLNAQEFIACCDEVS